MKIEYADRIKKLPPYLFEEIDKAKQKAVKEGRSIIDLGVGDPDMPTPNEIVEELKKAVMDPSTHKYALNKGLISLRKAMSDWYKERFNVDLDPEKEVLPLLGSKDGISHAPLAFINPGDVVLAPNPGYPPYNSGGIFAGANVCFMPLVKENNFLPKLEDINKNTAKKAKLIHVNYPNNPTGGVADGDFYDKLARFAKKNEIIVCSDAAYTEISFGGYNPVSFLESKSAREVGIEFHSLSKTVNMTGWRVGMAVGNADILAGLAKVKSNIDSGIFTAIQIAAIKALKNAEKYRKIACDIYEERRDVLINGLNSFKWKVPSPRAAFYVWASVFGKYNSASLAKAMLECADIVVTPGNGFGEYGEGYVRMALTVDKEKLKEAVSRIGKVFFS